MRCRDFSPLALETLSEKPCNSMSRNRDGFNIGEGAAIFLMERSETGIQLAGVGESSDAHHMSAPDPEGRGAHAAMAAALRDAGLEPRDIAFIHLHGTGTPLNDQMESRAVSQLFAQTLAASTKGMLAAYARRGRRDECGTLLAGAAKFRSRPDNAAAARLGWPAG